MGFVERYKIGFMLMIFVVIWSLIAGVLAGIVTFPITLLVSYGIMSQPAGLTASGSLASSILSFVIIFLVTPIFFGLVVPLLPESWFLKNWQKAKQKSVF